ncbi:hypothetical protein TREES_T100010394 [Tupaia chinensis]|uniref:Uncharacterized protein n=1 Tax=Tupaia chinensis TaxID=246437 RepID=L9LD97_TUPCH|nr:hypothetical protein TREES_T100010394 [Tupaia chinensis]
MRAGAPCCPSPGRSRAGRGGACRGGAELLALLAPVGEMQAPASPAAVPGLPPAGAPSLAPAGPDPPSSYAIFALRALGPPGGRSGPTSALT